MKRIGFFLLSVVMMMGIVGCSGDNSHEYTIEGTWNVTATLGAQSKTLMLKINSSGALAYDRYPAAPDDRGLGGYTSMAGQFNVTADGMVAGTMNTVWEDPDGCRVASTFTFTGQFESDNQFSGTVRLVQDHNKSGHFEGTAPYVSVRAR